jgi:hypothetical protein
VKTVTIVIHPGDKREIEVRRLVMQEFPTISEVEFREDQMVTTPRAVRLIDAQEKNELMGIDSALFRHFNEYAC